MLLALQKFALKEDKLELKCHDQNLMTKRDIGFDYEDICGKLEIIPGFQTWFDATLVYRFNECNRRSYNS